MIKQFNSKLILIFFVTMQLTIAVIDDEIYAGDVLVSYVKNFTYASVGHQLGKIYLE